MYKQEERTDRLIDLRNQTECEPKFAFPLATFTDGASRINVCLDDRQFVFYQLRPEGVWQLATHVPIEIAEKLGAAAVLGIRRHECLDCKSKWMEPVRKSQHAPTAFIELAAECPWCMGKNCASEPQQFVYEYVR